MKKGRIIAVAAVLAVVLAMALAWKFLLPPETKLATARLIRPNSFRNLDKKPTRTQPLTKCINLVPNVSTS